MKKIKNSIKFISSLIKSKIPASTDFRRGAGCEVKKKAAFTLAEVLIALAIIGIIAAVTLPNLIKNYQHKVLEVKFKHSLSVMQNAIVMAKQGIGVESFNQYCTTYNSSKYIHARECELAFIRQMKRLISTRCKNNGLLCTPYSITRQQADIHTYNGKKTFVSDSSLSMLYDTNIISNSYFIGVRVDSQKFNIAIDLNGYAKPNRVGHDIFIFKMDNNDNLISWGQPNNNMTDEQAQKKYANSTSTWKSYYIAVEGNPCNLISTRKGNGIGCTYYALRNECPWDSTRTYWECLP